MAQNRKQGKWTHRFSRKPHGEKGEKEMSNDGSTPAGELSSGGRIWDCGPDAGREWVHSYEDVLYTNEFNV